MRNAGRNTQINLGTNSRQINALSQPLGRITGQADEFTKSMEAANARVFAFGASVGIINGVTKAFSSLVKNTIEVEKSLVEINTVLGASSDSLQKFGNKLFDVAKNTGQTFDVVAKGALELARQGLSTEETLKRINDALILSRLSGLDAQQSVEGLTAAFNSFKETGITTSEILNKLVVVSQKYSVSERDLIEGLKRSASVADQAGVSFDELVGIITTVQERTARGGAVIGNAFKTIFARIQDTGALQDLSKLGIKVTDLEGKILPATKILQNLGAEFNNLSQLEQADITKKLGGVYQLSNLLAAVKDLSSEQSKYNDIVKLSAGATNEAYQKNAALNETLASLINKVSVSAQQLGATLGKIGITDSLKGLLSFFNNILEGIQKILGEESALGTFVQGLAKGIGNVLAGPGLALFGAIIAKLSKDLISFGIESLKSFFKIGQSAKEIASVEKAIAAALGSNLTLQRQLFALEGNRAAQLKLMTDAIVQQEAVMRRMSATAGSLAGSLYQQGVRSTGGQGLRVPQAAGGYMPAVSQESRDINRGVGGAKAGDKPVVIPNFAFGGGKKGTMVAHTGEYIIPNFAGGGSAIFNRDMVRSMGLPAGAKKIGAAGGFIPNFAEWYDSSTKKVVTSTDYPKTPGNWTKIASNSQTYRKYADTLENYKLPSVDFYLFPDGTGGRGATVRGALGRSKSKAVEKAEEEQEKISAAGEFKISANDLGGIAVVSPRFGSGVRELSVTGRIGDYAIFNREDENSKIDKNRFITLSGIKGVNTPKPQDVKGLSVDINRLFADRVVDLAYKLYGGTFDSASAGEFGQKLKSLGDKQSLLPPTAEGQIFEAAGKVALNSIQNLESLFGSGEENRPFDFQNPKAIQQMFGINVLRGDAKRGGESGFVSKEGKMATSKNNKGQDMIRKSLNDPEYSAKMLNILKAQGAFSPEMQRQKKEKEISNAVSGFIPNFASQKYVMDTLARIKAGTSGFSKQEQETFLNKFGAKSTGRKISLREVYDKLDGDIGISALIDKAYVAAGPTASNEDVYRVFEKQIKANPYALRGLVSKKGFIPNFADPLKEAIGREMSAGVPASQIYVDQNSSLKNSMNPMGLMVANRRDEPTGGMQGINRARKEGANPMLYGAAGGYIPNYAPQIGGVTRQDVGRTQISDQSIQDFNKSLNEISASLRKGSISFNEAVGRVSQLSSSTGSTNAQVTKLRTAGQSLITAYNNELQARNQRAQELKKERSEKRSSNNSGADKAPRDLLGTVFAVQAGLSLLTGATSDATSGVGKFSNIILDGASTFTTAMLAIQGLGSIGGKVGGVLSKLGPYGMIAAGAFATFKVGKDIMLELSGANKGAAENSALLAKAAQSAATRLDELNPVTQAKVKESVKDIRYNLEKGLYRKEGNYVQPPMAKNRAEALTPEFQRKMMEYRVKIGEDISAEDTKKYEEQFVKAKQEAEKTGKPIAKNRAEASSPEFQKKLMEYRKATDRESYYEDALTKARESKGTVKVKFAGISPNDEKNYEDALLNARASGLGASTIAKTVLDEAKKTNGKEEGELYTDNIEEIIKKLGELSKNPALKAIKQDIDDIFSFEDLSLAPIDDVFKDIAVKIKDGSLGAKEQEDLIQKLTKTVSNREVAEDLVVGAIERGTKAKEEQLNGQARAKVGISQELKETLKLLQVQQSIDARKRGEAAVSKSAELANLQQSLAISSDLSLSETQRATASAKLETAYSRVTKELEAAAQIGDELDNVIKNFSDESEKLTTNLKPDQIKNGIEKAKVAMDSFGKSADEAKLIANAIAEGGIKGGTAYEKLAEAVKGKLSPEFREIPEAVDLAVQGTLNLNSAREKILTTLNDEIYYMQRLADLNLKVKQIEEDRAAIVEGINYKLESKASALDFRAGTISSGQSVNQARKELETSVYERTSLSTTAEDFKKGLDQINQKYFDLEMAAEREKTALEIKSELTRSLKVDENSLKLASATTALDNLKSTTEIAIQELQKLPENIAQKMQQLQPSAALTPGIPGQPSGSQQNPFTFTPLPNISSISKAANSSIVNMGADMARLNSRFRKDFEAMAADYELQTGEKIQVTDGYRSFASQVDVKRRKPNLAATPGTSMHGFGLAIDASPDQMDKAARLGLLQKHGFYRPMMGQGGGKYEPWHIESSNVDKASLAAARSKRESGTQLGDYYNYAFRGAGLPIPATMTQQTKQGAAKQFDLSEKAYSEAVKIAALDISKIGEAAEKAAKEFLGADAPAQEITKFATSIRQAAEGFKKLGVDEAAKKEVKRLEDIAALKAIQPQTFSKGWADAVTNINKDVSNFQYELGQAIPTLFSNNLSQGIQDAITGAKSLEDALVSAALSFVQEIQSMAIKNLANQFTSSFSGFLGFSSGGSVPKYASGGMINGGSGSKDDVPAMLMGGEYVINKKSVQKYGPEFLRAINSGTLGGYAKGGTVKEPPVQTGVGGFYTPGDYGLGGIQGRQNLLDFATQTATSGQYDVIRGGDNYASINLEAESMRLTNFGRSRGPMADALRSAKEESFGLYQQDVEAEKQRREQEKELAKQQKAMKKQMLIQIGMAVASAAISSAGNAGIQGAKAGWTANAGKGVGSQIWGAGKGFFTGAQIGGSGPNVGGLGNWFTGIGKGLTGNFTEAGNYFKLSQIGDAQGLAKAYNAGVGFDGKTSSFTQFLNKSGYSPRAINLNPSVGSNGILNWTKNLPMFGKGADAPTNEGINDPSQWTRGGPSTVYDSPIPLDSIPIEKDGGVQANYLRPLNKRYATGGVIPSTSGIDTVPAMLSGGEFIMNRAASQNIGAGNLQALNAGAGSLPTEEKTEELNDKLVAKLDELIVIMTEGGSSGAITINVDSNGKSTQETSGESSESREKLARQIKDTVMKVIEQEKRLGGKLRRGL
jgi:TP901 family phage tail tape measure protein